MPSFCLKWIQYNVVTVVLSIRQCLQIVKLFAQRPVCLCLSQWDRERKARQKRYVLWAMLHDQRRGLGWEVRDMRGCGGRGFQSQWLLGWDPGIDFSMISKELEVTLSWGWTQTHVLSALDMLVGKSWHWQTIGIQVLAHSLHSLLLWRDTRQEADKRMGGLTVRGYRSQSRSQQRTHWRGRKFTSAMTLLCVLWSHSESDKVWSASLKFQPRCLLRTVK